jgi:molybdopterin-binding protein
MKRKGKKLSKVYRIISGKTEEPISLGLRPKSLWTSFPTTTIAENLKYLESENAYVEEFELSRGKRYSLKKDLLP